MATVAGGNGGRRKQPNSPENRCMASTANKREQQQRAIAKISFWGLPNREEDKEEEYLPVKEEDSR